MENDSPTSQTNQPLDAPTIFAALRDALATLYPEEANARVVVADAGLDARQIAFSARAQTNWHNILDEAIRQKRLDPLLKVALANYTANPALTAAYGQYRLLVDQDGYLETLAQLSGDGIMITGDVEGGINRAVITGRDVIGSLLITGDHNQVFIGNYQPLGKVYKEPWEVFERTSRLPFTGREWLLAEVDTFLHNHDRGYLILEANAGLGKTAFLVWLTKERGYIHHFCELTPGAEGVSEGLKNLAAQLALAYKLEPEGVLLVDVASHPSYLSDLLKRAADNLDGDEKIVVVVDALDESNALSNQNVMGLPATLPKGVYFIVSQRPAAPTLNVKDPIITARQYLRFSAEDEDNQADMRRFLAYAATLLEIVHVLQESKHNYTSEQFITTLMDKCRGVWIYLYFVVQEIRQGDRSPLDLAALPDGMTQYYTYYWRRWREADEEQWDAIYLPLLTTLAAAQESLSLQQLIKWSGAKITERNLRRLLEREWRPFLTIAKDDTLSHYRFYHATLQEFFDGQLEQNNLSLDEIELVEELAEETRKCHQRLADRYLDTWGGWIEELNGLKDKQLRDMDGRYGLRYLVAHLKAAGRISDIHRLLRLEWTRPKSAPDSSKENEEYKQSQAQLRVVPAESYQNVWYTVREEVGQTDGYLADTTLVQQLAKDRFLDRSDAGLSGANHIEEKAWRNKCIGLQCRYALILASLNSHAHNIGPSLLVELIKKNVWLPTQGLAYARQVSNARQQVEMLVAVAPFLPDKAEQERVLTEALGVVRVIEDSSSRADALTNLAPHLSPKQIEEALAVARAIQDRYYRGRILTNLAPCLAKFSQTYLYPLWCETLPILSSRTRDHLLSDLAALSDVIVCLGGSSALAEAAQAIQDVGRWWP
ncbi:MAG: effector-associated domain EAD1-containing protein [Caldilineaceae bacterium]